MWGFDGADGYSASVAFENVFERLLNPFTVGGATIAAGEYESNEAVASYSTSSAREVSFVLGLSYGGYFGGGMGILMLATFTLLGMRHMHRMNALKTRQASCGRRAPAHMCR